MTEDVFDNQIAIDNSYLHLGLFRFTSDEFQNDKILIERDEVKSYLERDLPKNIIQEQGRFQVNIPADEAVRKIDSSSAVIIICLDIIRIAKGEGAKDEDLTIRIPYSMISYQKYVIGIFMTLLEKVDQVG